MKFQYKKLTTTAIFAAIICVVTTFVAIPAPAIGSINLGDIFILCAAWLLGPIYGALAAGIGACLADVFSGFAIYAPATLVIKALMAVCCYFVYSSLAKTIKKNFIARFVSALCSEFIMMLGYFAYECIIYTPYLAIASVPFNLIQGFACFSFSVVIGHLLFKSNTISKLSKAFLNTSK